MAGNGTDVPKPRGGRNHLSYMTHMKIGMPRPPSGGACEQTYSKLPSGSTGTWQACD